MNNIKIKVNGVAISLENSPVINDTSLEDMSALLSKESDNIEKMIKATALLSDIKTVESFGYVSTEGVGESIKNAAVAVKNKLIEWFKLLIEWFKNAYAKFAIKGESNPKLREDFRQLVDKIHAESKANIRKLTSTDVSSEEIDEIRGKQKVFNAVRSASVRILRIVNLNFIKTDELKKHVNIDVISKNMVSGKEIANTKAFNTCTDLISDIISVMKGFAADYKRTLGESTPDHAVELINKKIDDAEEYFYMAIEEAVTAKAASKIKLAK